MDEAITIAFRNNKIEHYTVSDIISLIKNSGSTPLIKKQKDMMLRIYRRVKFYYLTSETDRKNCDQLISMLESWQGDLKENKAVIYILWNYFLRDYTFNYVSSSPYGRHIVKHHLLTDNYWVNQMALWEKGTSYGECDSEHYEQMKHEVNGTGHNSSCYLNILRAINTTKDILL